jgi:putative ABC transport system permease protein
MGFFIMALRNIFRRPRRSLILLIIIAGSAFLFFIGNSVFDGTSKGISESFSRSFTGDIVIRPKDVESYSLFGNETPVIGELTKLPELAPFQELTKYLSNIPEISVFSPQLSGVVILEVAGYRVPSPLFGISGEAYFKALPGISISRGRSLLGGERGILISEARAREIESFTKQKIELGRVLQLIIATDSSFRIRALPIVGFTSYPIRNDTLDRIVLIDSATLRSLYGLGSVNASKIEASKAETLLLDSSIDELFGDAPADNNASGAAIDRRTVEADLIKHQEIIDVDKSSGIWNYLVLKVAPGVNVEQIRIRLNAGFKVRGWPVEAIPWRDAAGSSALFIYWLRIIFNAGIVVVAFAGLIVIINALVSGVLERTSEIGAMRALGAQRSVVRRLFALETTFIAFAAGILGTILGIAVVVLVSRKGITLANPFLIQLFGGPSLQPAWGLDSIMMALFSSLLMGSVAWIYPVHLALKIEPIEAMRRGE